MSFSQLDIEKMFKTYPENVLFEDVNKRTMDIP